ncbi:MAG TPA: response regulator [Chthoniobacterales bacterium]|jgi:PAS domain S-box-containing protein|nr:response regulator [Chthoniobacterales bacterium]
MKILLVEDHPGSRRNLQRLIAARGHEVTAVGSAEEAEATLAAEEFPFLILDWMLPGKSGVDLCRELRTKPNGDEMFILLVTAKADTEDLEQALEAGANDYLTKPLDVGLLNVRISVAERQIRELTERNQARAALQESATTMTNILEKTTDGFFAVDSDWKITYVNAEAENMVGRKRSELLGGLLWEQFPALVGSIFQTNYEKVMAEHVAMEFEAGDSTGKTWYNVHAYPSNGGVSVFFRDISERKKSETERLTTSKLESLGTLAGGIAHDLNNILTVISGNIGLAQIEAPLDSGSLLGFLSKAGQAAQHAAHLSSQLLTFSKGGAPLKKIVSMGELLEHAAEFALYGSNLRADFDVAVDLWKAEVDPGQIEQVINALMLNAREAMPQGGTIRVRARNIVFEENSNAPIPSGRYVKVSITDRGSGVSEDLHTKIFDPYFTTKATGTGLGLAISYSIIKKHGGLLLLESSTEEGAVFAFYLRASEHVGGATPETRSPGRPFHYNHQRILVMDDEAAIRELTSQLLGTLGYEVTAVPDGLEAVRLYERALRKGEHFQAVILDATVRGGMGGVATIERLRTMDPKVNAIICSGYSDEAALSEFLAFGFRGALPKPFTRSELADALQRTFETTNSN